MAGVNLFPGFSGCLHLCIPRVAGVNLPFQGIIKDLLCIPRVAGVNPRMSRQLGKRISIPRVAGVNLCYLYPQAFAVRILHVVRVNLVRSILSGL